MSRDEVYYHALVYHHSPRGSRFQMSIVRLGIMGCADIAWRAMAPAALECTEVELVAAASRTAEKAQRFAVQFNCDPLVGYDKLLERDDIDAIYMPLPTGLHYKWVIRTLLAGKHILVEKSFAPNYATCQAMVKMAQEKNILILENFLFPHHSQHDWVNDYISRGKIGEVQLFRSTFGFPPLPKDNFRYSKKLGGGSLLDVGAYVVKAASLFLGSDLILLGAALKYDDVLGVDIYGDALFKNLKGQVAQLSFGFNYFYQCHYELLGSKGKIVVERAFTPPPGFRPAVHVGQQGRNLEITLPADNHYVNMLSFFAVTVRTPGDFPTHWNDLLLQAGLLESIRKEGA